MFDAVEIRPVRLPVIGVARDLDVFLRLEVDEFERAGADRMLAHVARRDMARIDHREAAGEQHRKRRLRPLQMKSDLVVAVRADRREVVIAGLARIDAQLLGARFQIEIPGAFDVPGGERLAVVPFDAAAQLEGQIGALLVPRPPRRQIGNNRLQAVLSHMLVEHDQIVEHPHYRQFGVGKLLEHRQARHTLGVVHPQSAAALLAGCRGRDRKRDQKGGPPADPTNVQPHVPPPRLALRLPGSDEEISTAGGREGYLSSQTSSMRQLLMMLFTIIVQPFTRGCQQYANRL